ncbi:MAG: SPOR domain-containing protein [Ruminobacter sp.]|nr:SPOR domain-containing protein [Ruminobacter sp.]
MVATVRTRKRSSKKGSKKSQISGWQAKFIILVAILIITMLGALLWQLQSNKQSGKPAAYSQKTSQQSGKKQVADNVNRYQYTEILEKKSIDTGSGVTITRNYEAETIARENARKKALAEKRRKLEEERRKIEEEKARIAEEKRRLAEEKRRLAEEKKAKQTARNRQDSATSAKSTGTDSAKPAIPGKFYIECAENYRTEKLAQEKKAMLAFHGKESNVFHKRIGGGYAFAVRVGPYSTKAEAEKSRAEIVNAKLGSSCALVKY